MLMYRASQGVSSLGWSLCRACLYALMPVVVN